VKKLSAFTLVHRPQREPAENVPASRAREAKARRAAPATGRLAVNPRTDEALSPPRRPQRVGLWDIDAYVGRLPALVQTLNRAQREFCFYELLAPVPAGLISQPERVRAWILHRFGRKRVPGLERNVIATDFFRRAEPVRVAQGLEYLCGMTASMIADDDDGYADWNLFSTARRRLLLVSSFELRRFANNAGRPFEVAVGAVVVAALLAARYSAVGYHDDTGCLFDYNDRRSDIVKGLKRMCIEKDCLELIPPRGRPAAEALVTALAAYTERRSS
jgi:hypothetical protein